MIGVVSKYDMNQYSITFEGMVWCINSRVSDSFIWSSIGSYPTFEEAIRALWSRLGRRRFHIELQPEDW